MRIYDVTDPANPVQLGTWTFDDGEHAFTYSLTKAGVPGTASSTRAVPSVEPSFTTTTSRSTGRGIESSRSITCRTVRASL